MIFLPTTHGAAYKSGAPVICVLRHSFSMLFREERWNEKKVVMYQVQNEEVDGVEEEKNPVFTIAFFHINGTAVLLFLFLRITDVTLCCGSWVKCLFCLFGRSSI